MGGGGDDLVGSRAFEDSGGGHESTAGVNHVVKDEAVFAPDAV